MNRTFEPLAPLLDASTVSALRATAAGLKYPKKALQLRHLDLCEAERALHVALARSDQAAISAAASARTEAFGRAEDEADQVADVHLSGHAQAIDRKPAEVADQLVRALALPGVSPALVARLESLLTPTIQWLAGENAKLRAEFRAEIAVLRARVADLEAVAAGVNA